MARRKSFFLNIFFILLVWLFSYWFKSNFLNRILCSFSINFPFIEEKKHFPSLMKNFFRVFFPVPSYCWMNLHEMKLDTIGKSMNWFMVLYWNLSTDIFVFLVSCYYRLSFFCLCAFGHKYLQNMRLDMEIFLCIQLFSFKLHLALSMFLCMLLAFWTFWGNLDNSLYWIIMHLRLKWFKLFFCYFKA